MTQTVRLTLVCEIHAPLGNLLHKSGHEELGWNFNKDSLAGLLLGQKVLLASHCPCLTFASALHPSSLQIYFFWLRLCLVILLSLVAASRPYSNVQFCPEYLGAMYIFGHGCDESFFQVAVWLKKLFDDSSLCDSTTRDPCVIHAWS